MRTWGEGVKKSGNFVDIINGCPSEEEKEVHHRRRHDRTAIITKGKQADGGGEVTEAGEFRARLRESRGGKFRNRLGDGRGG